MPARLSFLTCATAGCFRRYACLLMWLAVLGFFPIRGAVAQTPSSERVSQEQFLELLDGGFRAVEEDESDRALALWLEAFDGSRGVAGLEEARLTLALEAIMTLGEGGYEPAAQALVVRRDAAERRLLESDAAVVDADEMVALNAPLAGSERSVQVYDRYRARSDADPEVVSALRFLLWAELLNAQRYTDLADLASPRAKELIPLMDHVREAIKQFERETASGESGGEGPPAPEPEGDSGHAHEHDEEGHSDHFYGDEFDLITEALEIYEVLLGSGRGAEAEPLKQAILRLEPEAEATLEQVRAEMERQR
jgi:hypothetical protein